MGASQRRGRLRAAQCSRFAASALFSFLLDRTAAAAAEQSHSTAAVNGALRPRGVWEIDGAGIGKFYAPRSGWTGLSNCGHACSLRFPDALFNSHWVSRPAGRSLPSRRSGAGTWTSGGNATVAACLRDRSTSLCTSASWASATEESALQTHSADPCSFEVSFGTLELDVSPSATFTSSLLLSFPFSRLCGLRKGQEARKEVLATHLLEMVPSGSVITADGTKAFKNIVKVDLKRQRFKFCQVNYQRQEFVRTTKVRRFLGSSRDAAARFDVEASEAVAPQLHALQAAWHGERRPL